MAQIRKLKWVLISVVLFGCCAFLINSTVNKTDNESRFSLTLVPPSPITNKVKLDIRGALWNNSSKPVDYKISLYIDKIQKDDCVYTMDITLQPGKNSGIAFMLNTEKYAGNRKVIMNAESQLGFHSLTEPIKIIDAKIRSTERIDGSWFEFYHWSEDEGRFWNKDIIKLTNNQWGELIKGMHEIDMNTQWSRQDIPGFLTINQSFILVNQISRCLIMSRMENRQKTILNGKISLQTLPSNLYLLKLIKTG